MKNWRDAGFEPGSRARIPSALTTTPHRAGRDSVRVYRVISCRSTTTAVRRTRSQAYFIDCWEASWTRPTSTLPPSRQLLLLLLLLTPIIIIIIIISCSSRDAVVMATTTTCDCLLSWRVTAATQQPPTTTPTHPPPPPPPLLTSTTSSSVFRLLVFLIIVITSRLPLCQNELLRIFINHQS